MIMLCYGPFGTYRLNVSYRILVSLQLMCVPCLPEDLTNPLIRKNRDLA